MTKEEYRKYLLSDEWKEKRILKFKSKRIYRCAICGSKKGLEVHHLIYKHIYDVETSDLRIFCHTCHSLTHELLKKGKIKYKNENHNSRFALTKNAIKKCLGKSFDNCFYKVKKHKNNRNIDLELDKEFFNITK